MLLEACADAYSRAHTSVRSFFSARLGQFLALLVGIGAAFLFFYGILGLGLPVLRHDWSIAPERLPALREALSAVQGWRFHGIGEPALYPLNYLAGIALAPVTFVAAGIGEATVILGLDAVSAWYCAAALGADTTAKRSLVTAALLLNPWVYNEMVAGHLYMPLACYAVVCLWRELRRDAFRPAIAILWLVAAMQQMQFLLPALGLTALYARRSRAYVTYAIAAILVVAPVAYSIAAHIGALQSIPNLQQWEVAQSVSIFSGLQLMGYGPDYATHFGPYLAIQGAFLIVAFVLAVSVPGRRRYTLAAGAAAVAAALIAGGTTGPIGPLVSWGFAHIRAAAVYRELYDLIGIVVLCYAFILVRAWARNALVVICVLGVVACYAISWTNMLPYEYFVSSIVYRQNTASIAPSTHRIALMPAFQPLALDGHGAGLDPATLGRPDIINAAFPRYPVVGALSSAWLAGNYKPLAALGVTTIVWRSHLRSLIQAQQFGPSVGLVTHPTTPTRSGLVFIHSAEPILGFLASVKVQSVPTGFGRDAIDVSEPCFIQRLAAGTCLHYPVNPLYTSNDVTDPSKGWVGLNTLAYLLPEAGVSPYGYYTQSTVPLSVHHPRSLLVGVDGSMVDQFGRPIASETHGLAWIRVAESVSAIICRGRCMALAESDAVVPSIRPTNEPPRPVPAIYSRPFDWLLVVQSPMANSARVLRFAEQFDPHWIGIALPRVARLPHFKIDGAINGWTVPPMRSGVVLINVAAAVTELLEALGLLAVITVVATSRRP